MRRAGVVGTVGLLLTAGLAVAAPAAAAPAVASSFAPGIMRAGSTLVAANGAYRARFAQGRLVVRTASGRAVWATSGKPTSATAVVLDQRGNLQLTAGPRTIWTSRTSGAGRTVLTMRNDGVLALTASRLLVWSTRVPSACPHTKGKSFIVDISSQLARMCANGQQVRATPVTTGASVRGDGTPRGSWRFYAKVRKTVLHPASGGAYKVRYWMPYDGAYGVHDSSWQQFAYGSQKYRAHGSHGCTHVPARAMAWLYSWARVGTRVTIKR